MRSVADELRDELSNADLALEPGERIERALALGRRALALYAAAQALDAVTARRALRALGQRGRTPSACMTGQ